MWRLSFVTTIYSIWKERNQRCFEGKVASNVNIIARMRYGGMPTDAILHKERWHFPKVGSFWPAFWVSC